MTKYKIKSRFHNTEATITVKDSIQPIQGDIISALEYEVYGNSYETHYAYAQRKLRETKAKLCGAKDCQCPFEMA